MYVLTNGDRLIDKIHGVSRVIDAHSNDGVLFHKEESHLVFRRSLTEVQKMKPAPPERRLEAFCRSVVIGLCMVALCTLVVILAGNVVFEPQTTSEVKTDE